MNVSERDFCAVRDRCVNLTVEYGPASVLICYGNKGKKTLSQALLTGKSSENTRCIQVRPIGAAHELSHHLLPCVLG